MTICDIAKEYNCNESALYKKFRRNKHLLEGHYTVKDGIVHIDDFVVDFLLPNPIKLESVNRQLDNAKARNKEYGRIAYDEMEYKSKIRSLTTKLDETEILCNKQKVTIADLERTVNSQNKKIVLLEKESAEQKAKIAFLENQLSEQGANKKNGIKGLFGKRQ